MRFVGIDLAWKCVDPNPFSTAVCVIDEDMEARILLATDDGEIISHIPSAGDCMVGIDASLKVPNLSGMRETEKLVRRIGINILPTSQTYLERKFGGSRGELLVSSFNKMGFSLARPDERNGRLIYEVFPFASIICMTGRSPAYKHGRLADRKAECLKLLETIQGHYPELRFPGGLVEEICKANSAGMKSVGDKIDSMLCAISVYRHAIYRGQTTQMIGDEDNGFILLCR